MRRGARKLVLNVAKGDRTLIDTDSATTLPAENQARIEEPESEGVLARDYESYAERARDWSRGLVSDHAIDPQEARERLRAIGYLE